MQSGTECHFFVFVISVFIRSINEAFMSIFRLFSNEIRRGFRPRAPGITTVYSRHLGISDFFSLSLTARFGRPGLRAEKRD